MESASYFCTGKPYFDAHSLHAAEMRGPDATSEYYARQSRFSYLNVINQSLMCLLDIVVLGAIGLDVVGGSGAGRDNSQESESRDIYLTEQDSMAAYLVQ